MQRLYGQLTVHSCLFSPLILCYNSLGNRGFKLGGEIEGKGEDGSGADAFEAEDETEVQHKGRGATGFR